MRARRRVPRWLAAVVLLVAAALAWWLGSPLFIRTTANETLPPLRASAVAVASLATPPAAGFTRTTAAPVAVPVVLARGELQFVDSIHNGKGPVQIVRVDVQRFLRFEDVAITNAPDVHVYLSRESGGNWTEATSLYLGALKATNGSFNYEIPQTADLAAYKSVVVWCRAFGVLVTWADLNTT